MSPGVWSLVWVGLSLLNSLTGRSDWAAACVVCSVVWAATGYVLAELRKRSWS